MLKQTLALNIVLSDNFMKLCLNLNENVMLTVKSIFGGDFYHIFGLSLLRPYFYSNPVTKVDLMIK